MIARLRWSVTRAPHPPGSTKISEPIQRASFSYHRPLGLHNLEHAREFVHQRHSPDFCPRRAVQADHQRRMLLPSDPSPGRHSRRSAKRLTLKRPQIAKHLKSNLKMDYWISV